MVLHGSSLLYTSLSEGLIDSTFDIVDLRGRIIYHCDVRRPPVIRVSGALLASTFCKRKRGDESLFFLYLAVSQ